MKKSTLLFLKKSFIVLCILAVAQLHATENNKIANTFNFSPPRPAAPAASGKTICSGTSTSITATGVGTLGWYSAATGGTYLGGGASFTTPVLNLAVTYYVQDSTVLPSATRTAVTININQSPSSAFTSTPSIVCTGYPVAFNGVSLCSNNGSISNAGSGYGSASVVSTANNNITMETWVNWSGNTSGNQMIYYNGNSGANGYGIFMYSGGNLTILLGGRGFLNSSANLTPGVWQHVAIVCNANVWSLYLNGVQYAVSNNTLSPRASATVGTFVGSNNSLGENFYGSIDEVSFWSVARSTANIQADMIACTQTATSGLAAYWSMNEGTGSTAADGSGNNKTLSLNSTTWSTSGGLTGTGSYAWNFGDGGSSSAGGVAHTFSNVGSYNVSLTVTAGNGCSSSSTNTISPYLTPTASISGTATDCGIVTLTASGAGSYVWSGGNSVNTATNTFSNSNDYTVTVTSTAGCSSSATQTVTVNTLPNTPVKGQLPSSSVFANSNNTPYWLATNSTGNIFVSNTDDGSIDQISPSGNLTGFISQGTLQNGPAGMAFSSNGNIYICNTYGGNISIITPGGNISDFISQNTLNGPEDIVFDAAGNLFVSCDDNTICKITPAGVVTTFVSTGLNRPTGLAFDTAGNLFVCNMFNSYISKITPAGDVSTFIGSGTFQNAFGIAFDASGNMFISDRASGYVYEYNANGLAIIAGNYNGTAGLTFDQSGNLYVAAGYENNIYKSTFPVPVSTSTCKNGSVTLISTPASGEVVDWYTAPSGGSPVATATSNYTVSGIQATTTFYAQARNTTTGCVSAGRQAITATVLMPSSSVTYASINSGGNYTFNGNTYSSAGNDTVHLTSSIGCDSAAILVLSINSSLNTWTGTTSSSWNTASNWSFGSVPVSGSGVIIGTAAYSPQLNNNVTIGSITFQGTGSLSAGAYNLNVTGDIIQSGTSVISGNVVMNGSSSQNISGVGTIGSLTVSNTEGVTITAGSGNMLNISGTLNLSSGTLSTGNNLTLKSTSITNSAEVGIVTGAVSGNVIVERYIPKGIRQFRDLGPSVYGAGSVFANWQEGGIYSASGIYGMYITGKQGTFNAPSSVYDATTGFDYTSTGNPSLYTYVNNVWANVSSTKGVNLDPFQGMRALVRGARNYNLNAQYPGMVSATTLRTTGQLVTGTVTFTTSGTSSTSGATSSYGLTSGANAWSLIANPYVCPVDWASIWHHNTAGFITSSYSYLDPTFLSAGYSIYVTYNGASGVTSNSPGGTREYIQSGQGFFIQNDASGSTPSLVINESDKAPASTHTNVFGNTKPNMLAVTLWKNLNGISSNIDGAVAVFNTDYTKNLGAEDSRKMMNPAENLYITESAHELSIDGLPIPSSTDVITLKLSQVNAGETYRLNIDAGQYAGPDAYIHDAYLNTDSPVSGSVSFTPTADPASFTNRFSIVFKAANIVKYYNSPKISVFPNPVTENVFNLQTINLGTGKYTVTLINTKGQTIPAASINHISAVTTETIHLNRILSAGMYTVILKSEDGTIYQSELMANCKKK